MSEVKTRVVKPVGRPRGDSVKPRVQAALESGNVQEVIDSLTERQRRFVEEYLVDFDQSAAAQRAGYNCSSVANYSRLGHEMLAHPGIRAAIDQLTIQRSKSVTLKPDYVMNKIKRTIETAESEGNHTAVLRGCEILARALGMFVERREISGPDGQAIKMEQVREAADSFTQAINSLIERGKEKGSFLIVGPEC